jgi:hypothetical protein
MSIEAWAADSLTSDAKVIRNSLGALVNPAGGILAVGALELAQKSTPNMSVIVKGGTPQEGAAFIPAWTTGSGPYFFHNTANYECPIEAAGASLPRVDTIVAQILDKGMGSAESKPQIVALKGTEKAGADKANLEGVASVPNGCYMLGYVEVPAKATSITTTNILNVATIFTLATGVLQEPGAPPSYQSWGVVEQEGGGGLGLVAGSGDYTFEHTSTGHFKITWDKEKDTEYYAILVTPEAVNGSHPVSWEWGERKKGYFTLELRHLEGSEVNHFLDAPFSFIVLAAN